MRAASVTLALLLGGAAMAAEHPHARLTYTRGAGTETCPDETALRSAVAQRLGYDPFTDDAPLRLEVTLSSGEAGLTAHLVARQPDGSSGERTLTAPPGACGELIEAAELAISIAIDPHVVAARKPVASSRPGSAAAAPPPEPPTDSVHLGVGLTGANEAQPGLSAGATLFARLQGESFSGGLEAWVSPYDALGFGGGTIETGLYLASVTGCYHRWLLQGCVLASAGAMTVSGRHYADAVSTSTPYFDGGLRVAFEWPGRRSGFSLQVRAEARLPFNRVVLKVGPEEAWRAPAVSETLGIAVVRHFW